MQMEVRGGFPLSPQQRRVWALQSSSPGTPLGARCALLIEGELDIDRLRASLAAVAERYEILRTVFRCPAGMKLPLQAIGELSPAWTGEVDLSGLDPAERERRIEELWRDTDSLFDLEQGPLLHATLVGLEPGRRLLLLRLPALCADAASLGNLAGELVRVYAEEEEPADEPLQYADLAAWQNELFEGEDGEAGRRFWRQWTGVPALALTLPWEQAAEGEAREIGCVRFELPAEACAALEGLAGARGVSLAQVLLAGWFAYLGRISGEAEAAVGAAFDGRSYEGLGEALGILARYLPVCVQLEPDRSFAQLVDAVQAAAAELYEWQEYFSWDLLPRRGSDLAVPAFATCFAFDDLPPGREAAGAVFTPQRHSVRLERAKVQLSWNRQGGRCSAELEYDARLLAREDAERMAAQLASLLASAARDPEAPLHRLDILDGPARQRLFVPPAAVRPLAPAPGACVHHLFERQAERTPDRAALVYEDERITFADLNARANQLAHHLRRLGVGPEVPVALHLDRSTEIVVSLLAVLKAGGCYVPLDPGAPVERLSFILRETGAPVIVGRRRLPDGLAGPGTQAVLLDVEAGNIARQDRTDPASAAAPENPAYVLFTSGSTGRPKGVVVEHRHLLHYLAGIVEGLDLPDGASYATVSTFAADLGNTAVFPALCGGGCLHVVSQDLLSDPERLARYFEAEAIDCLKIVPSHLEALQACPRPERLMPRRRLVVGGEASRLDWIERVQALAPECRIVNHYGPTETTVGVLTYPVGIGFESGGHGRSAMLPLGRPLAGTRVYILDRWLQPVPEWVAGELCIAGPSVTRGYLGRPELTAERFLPDPFGGGTGERLYRTGDLARHRPDGVFEFLGRIDDQVKIRGFRVELGEIETVLREHPRVRQAAVAVREDRPGQKRLVAYVASAEGEKAEPAELRSFLEGRLPEVMVPAAFVLLPKLPLTANGKVDRQALPAPEEARQETAFVAPRTAMERVLAEIWSEVLGVERVGAHDNFFHLGGDSIRSITVRGKALERGLDVPVAELFAHPTIESLALRLGEPAGAPAVSQATAPFSLISQPDRERLPEGVEDAYPLTRLQAGMLFHSELNPESAIYHDMHSFHVRVPFDRARLERSLRRVAARHATLRTSFDLSGFGEPLQLVHRQAEIPLAVVDLRGCEPSRQEALIAGWIAEERRRSFDWARPPLFALFIHRRSEETLQVTLSFHHCIVDGWSTAALTAELFQHYLSLLAGAEPPEAPPLAVSFRDFVALERQALESPECRAYWQRQMSGLTLAAVPRLWAASAPEPAEARTLALPVSREVSQRLKRLAESAGAPIKSVLLAAHLKVMSLLAGGPDVVTGLISNGRPEEIDGDNVLGLFLNTLPFRLGLQPGTWSDLVRDTLCAEQELMGFRRYPLMELQRAFGGPLFETAFNFVHYHVYQGLTEFPELGVLSQIGYEETNFVLEANFSLTLTDSEVYFWLSYRAPDVAREQVERIGGWYLRVLEAMSREPGAVHAAFSPLSEAERRRLAVEWNDTAVSFPLDHCAHELFAEQAARTPDAVAVVYRGEIVTYRDLDCRSAALASRLAALGVGPDALVALLAERGLDFWVAALAIARAGGAWLPLDPRHPAERQSRVLAGCGAALVVVERDLRSALDDALSPVATRPCLATLEDLLAAAVAGAAPAARPLPANLAYVIYTSGSTGEPKGAMVEHRGMLNHLFAKVRDLDLSGRDVVAQTASQCFDISVWQFFAALLVGGSVLVLEDEVAHEPRELLAALERGGVTILETVPSLLRHLLDEIERRERRDLGALRWLIPTGEALPPDLCRAWHAAYPDIPLLNAYGPTECSDDVSHHPIRTPPAESDTGVPIGRPVANLRLYVVGRDGLPVPAGVAGELCVGGAGVGRGYRNDGARTAEVFVPDAFGGEPGGRLYRTGDLARHLPSGDLEFLGRIDHQVKIRGHRIELGEIEAALTGHPGVRETVVMARPGSGGEKRLVAYVVAEPGESLQLADLRDFAAGRLPESMIPSAFVVLPSLPLSPNGKVDRKALPEPGDADRLESSREYVAPRAGEQELVAEVWAEVLGRDRVGAYDDFFELGGDSLSATRAVSRIRALLDLDVPLRNLFELPTLAAFTAGLEALRRERRGLAMPPLRTVPRGGDLPLSFAQERLWFLDQLAPGAAAYNVHRALGLAGRLDAGGSGAEPARDPAAPRSAAHPLRRRFGSPPAEGRGAGGVAPAGRRPPGPAAGRARSGSPEPGHGGGLSSVRPGAGADAPGLSPAAAGRRARGAPDDASHRLRCLVRGAARPGGGRPLRGLLGSSRAAIAAARALRAVWGLRLLAAAMAAGGGAGGPARVLARDAGRPAGRRRSSGRPASPGGPFLPGSEPERRAGLRPGDPEGARPPRRRDALHGPDRGRPGAPSPLHRAGGRHGRHSGGQPEPARARAADRLLHQHPGAADRRRGDPAFRELLAKVRREGWKPTPTRTCPSKSWWRRCSRSAI